MRFTYLKIFFIIITMMISLSSCDVKTVEIQNEKKGQFNATMKIEEISSKKIMLDSNTAPKPQYIQMYTDSTGIRNITFLNTYTNSIYFYNYDTLEFIKDIKYDKQGPDGIGLPYGYHIKNMDSIYVYNYMHLELILTNSKSRILSKIPLTGGEDFRKSPNVLLYYPQFLPETSTPFLETPNGLLLTAQYIRAIPDSLISKIKFLERFNYKTNEVNFSKTYPISLYGNNYNWDDEMFTKVFPELHPDGDKIIFSFPISHDIYVTDIQSNNVKYIKKYAGSNYAGTIKSINKEKKKTTREKLINHIVKQDLYATLKYDKYRKVYYRFIRKAISNATIHTQIKEKPLSVIIMDENFNYLGETDIGTSEDCYWQNSFVTKEGLNIEYLDHDDLDEVGLNLKIFLPKKI